MSRTTAVVVGITLLVCACAAVSASESRIARRSSSTEQAPSSVQRLAWLAGCWEHGSGATTIEEQWMPPRGGMTLGMARVTRRDTVTGYEHLRIFERGGKAVYAAMPSGQAPAEFEAEVTSDSAVTFSNPAHDFPQHIVYRRRGADSLIARIEGVANGQQRAMEYPFRRVGC